MMPVQVPVEHVQNLEGQLFKKNRQPYLQSDLGFRQLDLHHGTALQGVEQSESFSDSLRCP